MDLSSRVDFYTSNSGPFALPRSDFTVNRVTQSRYIEPKHANHVPRRFFRCICIYHRRIVDTRREIYFLIRIELSKLALENDICLFQLGIHDNSRSVLLAAKLALESRITTNDTLECPPSGQPSKY